MAFGLSFFIKDVHETGSKSTLPSLHRLRNIFKITLQDRKFLLFILGESSVAYATWAVSVMLNQTKYISLGLTEQHIGWIEIIFSALALTGAWSAVLTRKMGFKKFMVTGIGIIAMSALVMGTTGNIILAIFSGALVEMTYTMLQPLINDLYSKRVTVSDRATQLSFYAMIAELFSFCISFLMSLITAHSYWGSFIFCTIIAIVGIFLFAYCYRGVRSIET